MEVDDIISYHDVVAQEKINLQKGMNYGVGKNYSVFLMSLRENAPYADALDEFTGMLTYEGHDEAQRAGGPNPKEIDQPLTTPKGSWTENGKFFRAGMDSKSGLRKKRSKQLLILRQVNSNALSIRYHCEELRRFGVSGRVCDCLPSKSDLLAERRLRDVLALRRIREATLLRDSDKVPELMNLHRGSDTPLVPPVCLRLADRMGAVAKGVWTGGPFWRGTETRLLLAV